MVRYGPTPRRYPEKSSCRGNRVVPPLSYSTSARSFGRGCCSPVPITPLPGRRALGWVLTSRNEACLGLEAAGRLPLVALTRLELGLLHTEKRFAAFAPGLKAASEVGIWGLVF